MERLLAALALGRPLERLERLAEAAGDGRLEELLLRAEEAEHVRLRDAGASRDLLGRRAVQAALGELVEGGVEDVRPAFGGSAPVCGRASCRDSK